MALFLLLLLGVRSAYKEDAQASAAELVFGQPLRLPGEFFDPQVEETVDMTDYLSRLRSIVRSLQPAPAARHNSRHKTFVFKELATATHVFLRDCTAGGGLKPAYSGPHKVLERGDKVFRLLVNGKQATVSIDRIKPAFILRDPDTTSYSPHNTTTQNTPLSPLSNNTPHYSPDADNRGLPSSDDGVIRTSRSGRRVHFPTYYRP
nr:uncharacterized protein LOC126054627 [Helicoverpa armigera]